MTIGGNTTGNITLSPGNNVSGGNVVPGANNVTDLGLNGLQWKSINATVYSSGANTGQTIGSATCVTTTGGIVTGSAVCPGSSTGGPFAELLGAIVPNNTTEDFLIGSQSTASALFAFTGVSSLAHQTQASISGQLIVMPNNGYSGRVGIGTTNPEELLHLQKDGDAYIKIHATTGSGQAAGIKFQRGTTSDSYIDFSIYDSGGNLYFDQAASGVTSNNMFIQGGNGNIGIGTTSPLTPLHIAATSATIGGRDYTLLLRPAGANTVARFALNSSVASVFSTNAALMGESTNGTGDFAIYTASDANFPAGTATWTNRMIVQNNGNVGIRISYPHFTNDSMYKKRSEYINYAIL